MTIDPASFARILRERADQLDQTPQAVPAAPFATAAARQYRRLADEVEHGTFNEAEPTDQLAGSIDRLRAALGPLFDTREIGMALNEAFRNGMRHEQAAANLPIEIDVSIPGLDSPRFATEQTPYWRAIRAQGSTADKPLYTMCGQSPNDVAVGRFKASLRKFLGVD